MQGEKTKKRMKTPEEMLKERRKLGAKFNDNSLGNVAIVALMVEYHNQFLFQKSDAVNFADWIHFRWTQLEIDNGGWREWNYNEWLSKNQRLLTTPELYELFLKSTT